MRRSSAAISRCVKRSRKRVASLSADCRSWSKAERTRSVASDASASRRRPCRRTLATTRRSKRSHSVLSNFSSHARRLLRNSSISPFGMWLFVSKRSVMSSSDARTTSRSLMRYCAKRARRTARPSSPTGGRGGASTPRTTRPLGEGTLMRQFYCGPSSIRLNGGQAVAGAHRPGSRRRRRRRPRTPPGCRWPPAASRARPSSRRARPRPRDRRRR